jgi:hypothetical protein
MAPRKAATLIERKAREVHAGQLRYREPKPRRLPSRGDVAVYVVTSAQCNTGVHEAFWRNLKAYARHRKAEILVAGLTYDQRQFARRDQVKARSDAAEDTNFDGLWYADEVLPYLSDDRVQLAPGLQWAGELNILPTAVRPLSGLAGYTGQDSTIVPHSKLALESVPTGKNEPTKFLYTTGSVTLRNYIQKRAGQLAEFHHAYAALVVEVRSDGVWFVRQLNATNDGSFQDLRTVMSGGRRSTASVDGLQWGDVHASEQPEDVRQLCWGRGGVLDKLRPRLQFYNDLLSFRSASHHERKSARARYRRWVRGETDVYAEVEATRAFLQYASRPWCEAIVVPSNHDEHADRWLDEGDHREDPQNSTLWHEANAAYRRARGEWSFAAWAFASVGGARVLERDESYLLHGIEMAYHGDMGPNGARGSTQGLIRMHRRICKGHDHTATIRDGVYSAGVCAYTLDYARGPSSWSVSHTIVYPNGKRAIITQSGGAYWAQPKRKANKA